jgi:D-3-phosphoglycerate dehydrogenase
VFNAGEANSDAVGEHTIGMMLSLFAKINKGDAEVRKMIWDRNGNRGIELSGRTVGIIGYGNTGKAVAKKLSGFGVRVLAYDKYLQNYSDRWATEAGMEEIFEQAELLTLHVPLTKETQKMVDQSYINKFRNNIWLFNLSRGGVVKTDEIPELMESGKLLGVGLDVLENENIEKMNTEERKWFTYIAGSDRTVITPHVAGWTLESYRKISEVLLKKIKDLKLNISAS